MSRLLIYRPRKLAFKPCLENNVNKWLMQPKAKELAGHARREDILFRISDVCMSSEWEPSKIAIYYGWFTHIPDIHEYGEEYNNEAYLMYISTAIQCEQIDVVYRCLNRMNNVKTKYFALPLTLLGYRILFSVLSKSTLEIRRTNVSKEFKKFCKLSILDQNIKPRLIEIL